MFKPVMTYKEFAKTQKAINPSITQPTLEKQYDAYINSDVYKAWGDHNAKEKQMMEDRDSKLRSVQSTSKANSKPSVVGANRNDVSEEHKRRAFKLALIKHAMRPVPSQAVIAAAKEKFPVVTYSQSGRTFVVVPDGCRLFLAPCVNGESIAYGFMLPTTNATWTYGLNDPTATERRILGNLISAAASANSNNFYNAAHPYTMETGSKTILNVDARGNDLGNAFSAVPTSSADVRAFARQTMASYSFELSVASTYLATALTSVVSTDSAAGHKDVRSQTMVDEDGTVGCVLRNQLSAQRGVESASNIHTDSDIKIVGPGQETHFTGNIRLSRPHWWFAGYESDTVVDAAPVNRGQVPIWNPWYGAYATGSYVFVEAVGGSVSVCFSAQRTSHVELCPPEDSIGDATSNLAIGLLAQNAHYTTTDATVHSAFSHPYALIGNGKNPEEARRNLDRISGVPLGSTLPVHAVPASIPHPPPVATMAKDIWGEVKGVGEMALDVGKSVAKGISFVQKAKSVWSAAQDIGEFAEGLGQLL